MNRQTQRFLSALWQASSPMKGRPKGDEMNDEIIALIEKLIQPAAIQLQQTIDKKGKLQKDDVLACMRGLAESVQAALPGEEIDVEALTYRAELFFRQVTPNGRYALMQFCMSQSFLSAAAQVLPPTIAANEYGLALDQQVTELERKAIAQGQPSPQDVQDALRRLVPVVFPEAREDEMDNLVRIAEKQWYQESYFEGWRKVVGAALHFSLEAAGNISAMPLLPSSYPPSENEESKAPKQKPPRGKIVDPVSLVVGQLYQEKSLYVWWDADKVFAALYEMSKETFPVFETRQEYARALQIAPREDREYCLQRFDRESAKLPTQTPEAVRELLARLRDGDISGYVSRTIEAMGYYADHAIRCGIAAAVYLSAHHSKAIHALGEGRPHSEVASLLPEPKVLNAFVRDYLATALIQPLYKKPKDENLPGLYLEYERLHLLVKKVKKIYDKHLREQSNWQAVIREMDGFESIPGDLLGLFDRNAPAPENYTDKNEYGELTHHQPANIALFWAARLCGDPDGELSISRLREVKREQEAKAGKKKER